MVLCEAISVSLNNGISGGGFERRGSIFLTELRVQSEKEFQCGVGLNLCVSKSQQAEELRRPDTHAHNYVPYNVGGLHTKHEPPKWDVACRRDRNGHDLVSINALLFFHGQ